MGRNTSGSLRYIEMGELMVEQQRWEARCTNDTSVEGAPRSLHDMQEKHRRLKRMADYQSHDYDPPDTQLDELVLRARTKSEVAQTERLKWLLSAVIGLAIGVIASCVDWLIDSLSSFKFDSVEHLLSSGSRSEKAGPYFLFAVIAMALATVAASAVSYGEPLAAGSGIPELKTYLNGVHIPGLLRIRTLVAKLGGVSFTIASGMVAGKEGPFVHGGGLLAAGLSQMASPSLGLDFKFPNQFRNDLDKRDFVAIGTAAGVACAFGAPIGGILFAVEEGASFYSTGITWRGFLATSVGVFTVQALFQLRSDSWKAFEAHFGIHRDFGLYNDDQAKYSQHFWWYVWEVPVFVAMGCFQGLMGALFVKLNARLTNWRRKHIAVNQTHRRVAEVLLIALVTCTVAFIATAHSPCRAVPELLQNSSEAGSQLFTSLEQITPSSNSDSDSDVADANIIGKLQEYGEIKDLQQIRIRYFKPWFCPSGYYSTMGQLFFTPLANALKLLCHLGEMQEDSGHAYIFDFEVLVAFYFVMFFLMTWTYGCGCAMGLFVPSLAVGAAFGQMCGRGVRVISRRAIGSRVVAPNVHTYAVIGAAGMLGGCTRMTVSITVLVMETTGAMQLVVPIMFTVFAAKWIGDAFSVGIYEQHIKIRGAPFLEEHQHSSLKGENFLASEKLRVSEVMSGDGQAMVVLPPVAKVSQLLQLLDSCKHHAFPVSPDRPTDSSLEFHLHGLITKSRILKMLEYRIGILVEGQDDFVLPSHHDDLLQMKHKLEDTPFKAKPASLIDLLGVMEARIDLRPFMHRTPLVVSKDVPLTRAYRLFRTMGLRHLFITKDAYPKVIGTITRKDLTEELAGLVLGEKAVTLSDNPIYSQGTITKDEGRNPMASDEGIPLGDL